MKGMAVAIFLSLFFGMHSWAQPNGGQNFSIKNATLAQAVEQLLSGTQYRVVYLTDDLNTESKVDLNLRNTTPLAALRQLLEQNSLTYSLRDENTVVIQQDPKSPPPTNLLTISGKVVDENNNPLFGAAVIVQGTSKGVVTDSNGLFTISATQGQTLIIEYLGRQTQTYAVNVSVAHLVIRLQVKTAEVDEVVVTGYSTTTKSRTPGSVAVLTSEDLQGAPLLSTDMLLKGKIAGVNVQAVSGRPGESAKIRIRGTNTLTGNAEPLWVVNGVPMEKGVPNINKGKILSGDFSTLYMDGIAGINPDDIESVTVLKDASAAAIYGARAAGGVIVVTTKRGKEGSMRLSYSGSVSLTTRPVRTADLMNSAEKLNFEQQLWNEFSKENFLYNQDPANLTKRNVPYIGITGMVRSGYGKYAGWTEAQQNEYLASLAKQTTNWFDELFRHAVSTKQHLSFSGGGDRSNYYVSFGYNNINGLLKENKTDSYSVNSTLGIQASDKVKIDFLTNLGYQMAKEPSQGTNVFNYAFFANPYERLYNEDGSYREDETYYKFRNINGVVNAVYPDNGFNLMRELRETNTETTNFSASETIQLTWNVHEDFSLSGMASIAYSNHHSQNINGANTYTAFMDRPFEGGNYNSQRKYGSITQSSSKNLGYTLRGQVNYDKLLNGKHYVTALAGAEISSQQLKTIYAKRYGYDPVTGGFSTPVPPSSSNPDSDINSLITIINGLSGQFQDEQALASFYFDADYTYDGRYTFKFSLRADGSNNFGHDRQFNPIWSAGLSWNIMRENFMTPLENIFSQLVFRTSTGFTGNINKNIYPKLVITYQNEYRYVDDEYWRLGLISSAPNPNVGWEKTFDYKFNLDMGFLKNRLSLNAEYYNRKSSRVISSVAVPSATGFLVQGYNTTDIVNEGVELSLGATILKGRDYSVSVFANGAYNVNKVTKYDAPSKGFGGVYVGYPTDALFAGNYIGINPYNGLYEFQPRSDAEFTTDKDYGLYQNYLVYLGTRTAPYNGGFGVSGSYKNFSASLSGSFAIGNKVINNLNAPTTYGYFDRFIPGGPSGTIPQTTRNDLYAMNYNVLRDQANRWTPGNPITNGYPRLVDPYTGIKVDGKTYITNSSITQAALLENVSYLKLSSISFSYRLGEKGLKALRLKSAEVSFLMNNIFTISTYNGIDPETPGAIYPQSKSFSLALRVGF